MIVGHGIDIVDIERFSQKINKTVGLRERLFVPSEQVLNNRSLAARFAAKEAVAKALQAPAGMNWHDVWIEVNGSGAPYIQVKGTVKNEASKKGITSWHLSLSHDGSNVVASVIAEKLA